jgi:peptide/nickel transport system permease protein
MPEPADLPSRGPGHPAGPDAVAVIESMPEIVPLEQLPSAAPRRQPLWVPVGSYVLVVFLLITFNFALPRLMPGDPIDALLVFGSPNYVQDNQTRAKLEAYYHLDESIPQQYVDYLGQLAHGDLGVSIYTHRPVRAELGGRIAWSLLLLTTATLLSVAIAVPLGIHSGWKRGKPVDRGLLAFFVAYQNLPTFVIAVGAFVVFSAQLGLFPLGGATTPFNDYSGLGKVADIARHLALPAVILALDFVSLEYLVMRSAMVTELGADYLLGGRAKGLRERRLKYRYTARNALLPVVTVVGLNVGVAVAGSILFVEGIFAYPGIGGFMVESLAVRDYPAMQGSFLVLTLTVVTVNLVVDLLYRRLDPRTAK